MTEERPCFGSRRFRGILWRALRSDPLVALRGFYWFATRRRVRGWAQLLLAVANGPYAYRDWIRGGERRAFDVYRTQHEDVGNLSVVALVVGGESDSPACRKTVDSLRVAFGDGILVYFGTSRGSAGVDPRLLVGPGLASALSTLAEAHGSAWLLAIPVGDQVSPALGDILARSGGANRGGLLIYWDEDVSELRGRAAPWVKPDWDELLFARLGGFAGASVVRLSAAAAISRTIPAATLTRDAIDRLALAVAADGSYPPEHIALILTHRATQNALAEKAKPPLPVPGPATWPSVSILIPTRDRSDLLASCLRGVDQTSYTGAIELVLIDNGTVQAAALQIMEEIGARQRAIVLRDSGPFNFARLNNAGAARATGDYLCFLNNDVEPLDADWLTVMISHAVGSDVGAVGALLLYPNGRIQHAGVAIGLGGAAGHVQKGIDPADQRFWTWHRVTRQVSAVTAAAMIVPRDAFLDIGGFDEDAFAVAFNDVDLCLRFNRAGLRNLYVAEARLVHHESVSRGKDRSPVDARRFAAELEVLQNRWSTSDFADPYYSTLFSRAVERCSLVP